MARPVQPGLNYFPLDVDFFQDIKVRRLIKYQGAKAVPVYTFLLCKIYQSGYFIRWEEDLPFVVYEATGCDEEYVNSVVECCASIGLFSADLFRQNQILTSKGIQERYRTILALTKRKVVFSEFILINTEETRVNSEETPINSGKSTQRKEKEIKEKKREEEDRSSSPSPPDFVVSNRENLKIDPPELRAAPLTLDEYQADLRNNQQFLETACMTRKVGKHEYEEALSEFFAEKRVLKHQPKSQQDVMQHFLNWLSIWKAKRDKEAQPGKLKQSAKTIVESLETISESGGFYTFEDLNT